MAFFHSTSYGGELLYMHVAFIHIVKAQIHVGAGQYNFTVEQGEVENFKHFANNTKYTLSAT